MNENIDLTKILEGCPVGTKFYSTIYGKVDFSRIISDDYGKYPIELMSYNKYTHSIAAVYCEKDGTFSADYEGECTLFPSEDQRDWGKFERFWDKPNVEKFDPNTLQPFDKVLVRDHSERWRVQLFSNIIEGDAGYQYFCINNLYRYCIPYNDDTKRLLGTTEEAPEFYRYWDN